MKLNNPLKTIFKWIELTISQSTPIDLMGNNLSDIFNFYQLSPTIATAGQPTANQLASVHGAGYRSIVNLAPGTHENALPNERELVESLGMEYIHIPVQFDRPLAADFDRFCEVMNQDRDAPIFVHCAANLRVSSFIYLYRTIELNDDRDLASADLAKIWQPNPVWQAFIDKTIARRND
jgi:protein tyrosine phosphatase (PTP) superfamily phosphohydrolase (DUF442 family)